MIMGDISTVKEQCSAGKSGSFFYYTPDNKFMIKTISHNEFERLKFILKNYYNHLANHPQTLITRYFGLHKIKYKSENKSIERIYFIVMANVFNTTRNISVRYDLKGSKYGRNTRKKKEDVVDPGVALKDLDFD
jgi:1-phosphatidylinositol-4-phosphate 5-kinase